MIRIVVTITQTGGQFTMGVLRDLSLCHEVTSMVKSERFTSPFRLSDGNRFTPEKYDELLHLYAPDVQLANLRIESVVDDEPNSSRILYDGPLEESPVTIFSIPEPWPFPDMNPGNLVVATKKYEKRISSTLIIDIAQESGLDIKNIFVGCTFLDEVFCTTDQILTNVLYIPAVLHGDYLTEHGIDENEEMCDYISDIFDRPSELSTKITDAHSFQLVELAGKNEWENDYLKLLDHQGNVLHESGEW